MARINQIRNMPIADYTTAIVVVYQHVPSSEYTQIFFKSVCIQMILTAVIACICVILTIKGIGITGTTLPVIRTPHSSLMV